MANPNDKPKTEADKQTERRDAGDPRTSGSPEQFLQEAPAHLAAQGDKAPPMPNAGPARRYFRVHDKGGVMLPNGPVDEKTGRVPRALRTAGTILPMDPEVAAKHPELEEVKQDGSPLDKIAKRETGEASGMTRR